MENVLELPSEEEALDAYSSVIIGVAEHVIPSVASLQVSREWRGRQGRGGSGSAVAYTPDGYLVTSAHVVAGSAGGLAVFSDGCDPGCADARRPGAPGLSGRRRRTPLAASLRRPPARPAGRHRGGRGDELEPGRESRPPERRRDSRGGRQCRRRSGRPPALDGRRGDREEAEPES